MASSLFTFLKPGSSIEVTEMCQKFRADPSNKKVNLSIGGYLSEDGFSSHDFRVVRKVVKEIAKEPNHSYLPPFGVKRVNEAAFELLFGPETSQDGFCVQSIGGTGPLRVGAEFLKIHLGFHTAYYSNPTWINHRDIFIKAGFRKVEPYPYWNDGRFDFESLLSFLKNAEPRSVVIFHTAAHNPTGIDPTQEQWKRISEIIQEQNLFPFFDCAYQGFATGNFEQDAFPVRYFYKRGIEFFVSQSFGKNLGLYGERIGFLSGFVLDKNAIPAIYSQLLSVIRPMYSNPCRNGMEILSRILLNRENFQEWETELKEITNKIKGIRIKMRNQLERLAPDRDWSDLTKQIGMFYYSGLTFEQGQELYTRFHVYILPSSGRINLGAIKDSNIDYICNALSQVVNITTYL